MEAGLVRHTPSPKKLIREQSRIRDRAEEVHPPFRTIRSPVIHIEEPKRNAHIRHPRLCRGVGRCVRGQAVDHRIRDEEVVERCTLLKKQPNQHGSS